MSESNPALALSYRLGRACLASLLLLPVALIIIVILTVVYNAHDAPPGHDVVFGLAAAPIVLFGFASTVLAIPGASLMYVHGSSARRALGAALRGIASAIPSALVAWWYAASVCWL